MTNHASPHGWFTLLHCGCFLVDPDAIVISELIGSNKIQLIFYIRYFNHQTVFNKCVCIRDGVIVRRL